MKIPIERDLIKEAWEGLRDAEIFVNTCSEEQRELIRETFHRLGDILKANPEPDLPYMTSETVIKHLETEFWNRQAIIEILDILKEHGKEHLRQLGLSEGYMTPLECRAEELKAKLVRDE